MSNFKSISVNDLQISPVQLFSGDTPLLCAGSQGNFNSMTIGWGTVGHIWGKPFAGVYVRQTRYTYSFMEKNDYFSINCFGGQLKDILEVMGSKSGRDVDKMHCPGLTPLFTHEAPFYEEAELVLICKKMYAHLMQPEFFVGEYKESILKRSYGPGESNQNFHKIYYGEIIHVLESEQ